MPNNPPEKQVLKSCPLKIAIVGSRKFNDRKSFDETIIPYLDEISKDGNCIFISGGAQGIDQLARLYAQQTCREIIELRPDYGRDFPKIAPLIRNKSIANRCDVMIAFWDGLSGGTANAIAWATTLGKKVKVFIIL